ncbi:hypothetical protein G7047_21065 [Diaphorobacter sp. HDW4A]|uniref:hypothetical protein n=1 Tax=Diaphorobacter sp. HDW4A TaxID=2714924 RepID=UPI00140D86CC|nr:hypothetical protein [Diaphorobacter sp. HDW4A]QIL82141.1 hypothetical protein G7047_21065 [Diaphorobacter sp. HDW4A]
MSAHKTRPTRPVPVGRIGVRPCTVVCAIAWMVTCASTHASPIGGELQQLTKGQRFERRISLSTLGVMGPSVNIPADSLQEFYLPAGGRESARTLVLTTPANQPAPAFAVNGAATVVPLTTPGKPDQLIRTTLPMTGSATPTRIGMQVGPQAPTTCDAKSSGAVALNPDTYLSYYGTGRETSNASTWTQGIAVMPERPFLLVAAPPLSRETFDTAWRIGLTMAKQGRPVSVHALPSVGDIVDTRALSVPPGLTTIAAFAGLSDASEHHAIASTAEIGALLMLDASGLLADIVVADAQLQSQLASALDALQMQITDEDALVVFQEWRNKRMPLARATAGRKTLKLTPFGARNAWAVTADGAASIASLDTQAQWQPLTAVADGGARLASSQVNHALLRDSSSGKTPQQQFTVQAPQNWAASFALTPPLASGHTPSHIQVSFQLPERASQQSPVGVLHWNGILLAARNLNGKGERETLAADIPVYALSAINVLQVSVKQDAPAGGCSSSMVIPTTALQFDLRFNSAASSSAKPTDTPSFADLISRLGHSADIAVPQSYLTQARLGLDNTIQLAAAANLSPIASRLVLVDAKKSFSPSQTFVALDVDVLRTPRALGLQDHHIALRGTPIKGMPWPQSSGVTAVQAVQTDGQIGLLWYPLGAETRVRPTGLLVNHGQLALLGPGSEVAWLNTTGSVVRASDANTAGTMYEWRSLFSWGVPVTLAALITFIALLVAAGVAARRAKRKSQALEGAS